MSSKKILNIEAFALTNSLQNILNCAVSSLSGPVGFTMNQPYLIITHIRAMNKTGSAATLTLYKGSSNSDQTAGKECMFSATSVAANDFADYDGNQRFDSGDFLNGIASASSAITLTIEAEIGISG